MKSVIQEQKECYNCGNIYGLHVHHIFFGTANRRLAEKRGLKAWLCYECHEGNMGVHHNRKMDLQLKRIAQIYYEEHCGGRKEFIKEFGKSYL